MASRHEPDRFEELYRSHRSAVYRFLLRDLRNREDAEDATQTAFLQAYTAYERGSRPERPRAWLLTIADNLRRRRFRTRERRGGPELPLEESLVGAREPDERVEDLRDALETLPFNQRAALVLREVAGLSYEEIARQLSVSVGAVQMLIFRARRTLREDLATASRRVGVLVPAWLTNLIPSAERLSTSVRVGGAAAVASVAAVAVTGAESPAPPATSDSARPVVVHAPATPAHPPTVPRASATTQASTRAAPQNSRRRSPAPPIVATAPAAPPVASPPASPPPPPAQLVPALPPTPVPTPSLPPTPVPTPSLPPTPVPTPSLPLPTVPQPQPALPLPPLPLDVPKELEGALDPQLDAVLAGR